MELDDSADSVRSKLRRFEAMFAGGRFAESREAEIEIPQWSHTAFSAMLARGPSVMEKLSQVVRIGQTGMS